jgi:hypothetical protein
MGVFYITKIVKIRIIMCPETLPLRARSSACVQPTFSPHSSSDPPWAISWCHRVCWHCNAEYLQLLQRSWSVRSQSNMNRYTFAELHDMNPIYCKAWGNGREAQRIIQERYPQQQFPHQTTFSSIDRRLEYCSFEINKRTVGSPRTVRTPYLEETVFDTIEEKPSSSTCTTARA